MGTVEKVTKDRVLTKGAFFALFRTSESKGLKCFVADRLIRSRARYLPRIL